MSKDNSISARALAKSAAEGTLSVSKLFDVSGWVVVGTGLGRVTASALADNGARVYISGRRLEPLQEAARAKGANGGEIIPVQADATSKEGITKLREAVEKNEKWVNLLVNNHGISIPPPKINEAEQTPRGLSEVMFAEDMDIWTQIYLTNTASYNFTTFAFLPLLAAAKTAGGAPEPGNIINIASMSGITKTSQRGQFGYNASKAATISLSHMQATEFARRDLGIRVNVICPGYFPSGMTVINPEENTGSKEHFDEFRKDWAIPLGRPGNAIDYAQCILSLATNRYVAGAEYVIDGGWLLESAY